MNTSHGNAVLPNNYRRSCAIAARKRVYVGAALVVLGVTFGMARAAAGNPDQPIQMDGMELFFGLIPVEILRGHPSDHEERNMHGGVPRGKGVYHLTVSVFDAKTITRISDAVVTASVTEAGIATQNQKLEAMSFGGSIAYGNYFAMSNPGPYEIIVNVRRPSEHKSTTAHFQYRHARE